MPTKEENKPRAIYWRYRKGLNEQAPRIPKWRVQNMREALNKELKRADVPAFQRKSADRRFVSAAKQALSQTPS